MYFSSFSNRVTLRFLTTESSLYAWNHKGLALSFLFLYFAWLYFFKIIFYWFFYCSCPDISPFASLLPSTPHSLRQSPHHCSCPWVMCISSWLFHSLYCTLHPYVYFATTYLYLLIPSPLHSFPHNLLPSCTHQNALCIHDSVSVLLVCLVCFLDSVVDRYIFIAILLFIVLIFFFFSKSL